MTDTSSIWLPYTQMKTAPEPIEVVSTLDTRIELKDGRTLIDGIASWWTAAHGYNHPYIVEKVQEQLEQMPHVMLGGLVHNPIKKLTSRIAAMLPGSLNKCFVAESGSVSVEVGMKMCLQYYLNRGVKGRSKFVHFRDGYHGDTLGTMGICDPDEGMHSLFGDALVDNYLQELPRTAEEANQFAEWLLKNSNQIAGVITEPLVQGAGGMVFHEPETLQWIRKACDQAGVLMIVDEIFTGFGRTGTMFAIDQAGIIPDVVTLSKALTGGFVPLSIAVAREEIFESFYSDDPMKALMHGPTYMGHALGCAAANASLDLFQENDCLSAVAQINMQLGYELEKCREVACVKDVRTLGAIGVVQTHEGFDVQELKPKFIDAGVWVRPFRDIVYLTPAYTITPDDLTQLTESIYSVLST
ncbi:adenosylmethionine--8-amino-7-oxononanoate transaminase [Temperatibacter marinus]|uniref:Adenosylmethionine-8-amino-7-oxononanoate aminotransferase n=1 Tax=Temperatibacter marinus TaxID=1456591 RepID=A0AA52EJT3_9PROT|nr:adenosylmethionine--8-amino-7-oxononanoate transaminase [Temperatibacter marinus]WND03822.1 adenosylmethionine--8-amino-7-oxononanoate transaminase [Temperatibacter marinus]